MQVNLEVDTSATNKFLDDLVKESENALETTLHKAGEEVLQKAKQNIMSKGIYRTGALYNSLKVQEKFDSEYPYVKVYADYPQVITSIMKGKGSSKAKAKKIYYAFAQEYGTKTIQARPYLHPAGTEVESKLADMYAEELEKKI